jgi:glycosyltransferase involved in cell wall biosynthesis
MILDDCYHLADLRCKQERLQKKQSYTIAFILPYFTRFAGGPTSILRLGTYLSKLGHNVLYLPDRAGVLEHFFIEACGCLPAFQGRFVDWDEIKDLKIDMGVATFWPTVYTLLRFQEQFDYKLYFVQDFEPFFYPMGADFLLAQKSYQMGLHLVSLGAWNKQKILQHFPDSLVDTIDFPVELNEYPIAKKKLSLEGPLRFAVYIKQEAKRAPQLLVRQLQRLIERNPERAIEVHFFGMEKDPLIPFGKQWGRLSHAALRELYAGCHFGIVASLTNISLVGYEMIASGLPVIDLQEGSAPTFFSDEEMIFVGSKADSLHEGLAPYLSDAAKAQRLLDQAQRKIAELGWEKSSRQFHDILLSV